MYVFFLALNHTHFSPLPVLLPLPLSFLYSSPSSIPLLPLPLPSLPLPLSSFSYHSQKVDLYSLGIIFFEMCHAPSATVMERAKMLANIRLKEILFPPSFDTDKKEKQVCGCLHQWSSLLQRKKE